MKINSDPSDYIWFLLPLKFYSFFKIVYVYIACHLALKLFVYLHICLDLSITLSAYPCVLTSLYLVCPRYSVNT